MNADGSNQTRLTVDPGIDTYPKWLRDGKIVFTSNRDGQNDIYVMAADGSNVARLTTIGATEAAWSSDGKRVAFISRSFEKTDGVFLLQVFVMDRDGGNLRMITTSSNSKSEPCWSPDGSTISFTVVKFGGFANVFQVDSDGGNLRRLTAGPTSDGSSSYSPDGSKLAFSSTRDGNHEIYVTSLR